LSLELIDLWVQLNDLLVLREINLKIRKPEYHVILGPSGAGKTTLLRTIAGLVEPYRGSIVIDGKDVTNKPPWERGVGLVHQTPGLLPHLTVMENIVEAAARRGGLDKESARREALRLAKILAITDVLDKKPGNVSGGQLQRAALAVALASKPRILLLDEPLSHLDRSTAETARRLLKAIQQSEDIIVVHVTHDIDEALALADTISVIASGRIEVSGDARRVYECPRKAMAATLLGHSILPGEVIGAGKGFYSVAPEHVAFKKSGPWLVERVEYERGRILVEARLGNLSVRGYLPPREAEWIPHPGEPVEPIFLTDKPCELEG
jgi:ABC-type sugar transport system ATPase subunit